MTPSTIGFGSQHEIYAHQTNEVVPVDALHQAESDGAESDETPHAVLLRQTRRGVPSSQPTTFYAAIPQAIMETTRKR